MRYLFIIGFVLMAAAQWYAPLSLVFDAEKTIEDGTEYRFRTQPVDPSDPFRGKYIVLGFDATTYHPADTNELHLEDYANVYATLSTDSVGFARVVKLTADPPTDDVDYMMVGFQGQYWDDRIPTIYLGLPFQRFYMEESKASEAEQLYWRSRFDSSMVSYARVKVRNGDTKLVDVMVNDSSIVDIVRRINAGKVD